MPSRVVRETYEVRVEAALASARRASAINHPGLQGEVREILVRELLRPLLPPTLALGTGKIIDHTGGESDQIDVVVYDRAVMPPLLFSETALLGLFPIEACVYAIEVKSTATPRTWRDASKKAASIKRLTYLPTVYGQLRPHPVLPTFFAFGNNLGSDPTRETELKRWKEYTATASIDLGPPHGKIDMPVNHVVCVAGQGYGVWWPDNPYDWAVATGDNAEMIMWITGIVNTLFEAVGRPPSHFGKYLV